jgi:hypothetical protein
MRNSLIKYSCTILLTLATLSATADSVYLPPEEFLATVFEGHPPEPKFIWITAAQRKELRSALGQELHSLRLRYWQRGQRSMWILDETGKDKPITTGVVIDAGAIETLQVLIFRESRGWEVKHPFFTDQFIGVRATDNHQLNRRIDGITGATLSVRALQRQAQLALFLAKLVADQPTEHPE